MEFLDKWERKLGWMSFPGFLRYYVIMHVMVFLLQYINPGIGMALEFDREKILQGEVWRLVTFLFSSSGLGGLGGFSLLAMYFMVVIGFMISDGLEGAWGVFRTSIFYYFGFICLLSANFVFSFLFPFPMPMSGLLFYEAAFFAFATLFPRVELLLFFILPVQIRWFALFAAVGLLVSVFKAPIFLVFVIPALLNYFFWAVIPALRGQARAASSASRKRKFNQSKPNAESAFHLCHTCKKTEISDPELDFRMAEDGNEYCEDHLPG